MFNRKNAVLTSFGAAAAVALGLLAAAPAEADAFVPLPGGEMVKTLSDGTVVTVRLVGESATISPSMGATPVHRNAWVSGTAQVELVGAGEGSYGLVVPGYTVGCQVNIAGGRCRWGCGGSLGLGG